MPMKGRRAPSAIPLHLTVRALESAPRLCVSADLVDDRVRFLFLLGGRRFITSAEGHLELADAASALIGLWDRGG
jgi:hypothetical protein